MKKTVRSALILPAALSLLLAAACGGSGGGNTNGGSEAAAGASSAPAAENSGPSKKIKMTMVTSQQAPIRKDAEMVAYYNEKLNMDIQVWDIDSTKWNELLNLKFASGEIPDNILVQGFPNLQKYVGNDLLAEIPLELIRKHAPTLYKMLEADVPGAFNYGKVDGKIYGIPQLRPDNRYRNAIVYRGDWMKALGFEKAPETLEEFERLMTAFAQGDPGKTGKKTYGLSKTGMDAVYGAFGYIPGLWQEKDGKLVYASVQPEMKQALAYLNKWYKNGILDPEFLTGENKGGSASLSTAFIQGRIGVSSIGQYYDWKPLLFEGDCCSMNYLELGKLNPQAPEALVYGMPPKGPDGKSGVIQRSMISGNFVGFGRQVTQEPGKMERMLEFYEYMFSSLDNYMISKFGIPGKHWEYNADKIATMIGEMKTTSDQAAIGAHTVLNNLDTIQYVEHRLNARYVWANQLGFREGGLSSRLLAPLPSSTKYLEELNKIEQETYISIITGDKPLDEFDRFVERWSKGGGEQLTKEANDWYAGLKN